MKLDIGETLEVVRETLAAQHIAEDVIRKSLANIQQMANSIKTEEKEEKGERVKKEFVSVIFETTDPNIFKGYVFQCDVGTEQTLVIDKIKEIRNDYNNSKRGKKRPASTMEDSIELPANKFFKTKGLFRKTKESVYVFLAKNDEK